MHNITNLKMYEDVVDKITVIGSNVSNLQGQLVLVGTNLSVGEKWKDMYTPSNDTGVGVGALGLNCMASACMAIGYNAYYYGG